MSQPIIINEAIFKQIIDIYLCRIVTQLIIIILMLKYDHTILIFLHLNLYEY